MSEWKARRFWTRAEVEPQGHGFRVTLDGRHLRTPAKAELHLPTRALAEAVAAEWEAQGEVIDPQSMPVTRTANSAIDKVMPQRAAVADMLAEYGGTDLLCYRAEAPEELTLRQAQSWDPLLDWAARALGAPLTAGVGVMHVTQPEASLAALSGRVHRFGAFELAALHDLVALSGSLVIGLAVTEGHDTPERLWEVSRIDETWQEEQWGYDDEARAGAQRRRADFLHAARVHRLCRAA
ncbi:MAG: ATP12 family chaperone protein [Paracoccaceae bacterium]